MKIFDWEQYRASEPSRAEQYLLHAAFRQYMDGHSDMQEYTESELERVFEGFRAGWRTHDVITGRVE